MRQESSDSERGREAARRLWRQGLGAGGICETRTTDFARAAISELELLQKGTPGVLREVLEGAQISAEQLDVESFHGLIEIVQNADDSLAEHIRVAVRKDRGRYNLLIVHDGKKLVELDDVLAMTLAFVSTKRDDARAKGRFGIGLKTLGRLGESLTVHCTPYHFTIEGNQIKAANKVGSLKGIYDATSTDTLFDLRLREGFDPADFREWFAKLGAGSLIFLDTVRSLRLIDLKRRQPPIHHHLSEVASETVSLPGIKSPCCRTIFREAKSGRSWDRYEVEWRVPSNIRRRNKATDSTTPIAIAVPVHAGESGQIYTGLPLGLSTQMPLSFNAQFDIDVARRDIQHEDLNSWLFSRIGDVIAAVALERLASNPARAWIAVPLKAECSERNNNWLTNQLIECVAAVQRRVQRSCRVSIDGSERSLRCFAYEEESLDGLLGPQDIAGLRPGLVCLPQSARDRERRWRRVLAEIDGATLIEVGEALMLLDWEDQELGARDVRWFIKLSRAAIEADLGQTLWLKRAVVTNDGSRIVPPMAHHEGELLLRSARQNTLAARLGLVHVIHPQYLSRSSDAVVVRDWLEEYQMLRDTPDSEGTLEALAARDAELEAIYLNDNQLRLLRDAFAALDEEARDKLGHQVGCVIAVDVQRWRRGKKAVEKGRPSEAYFSSSIEDRRDGWCQAAAKTPELSWIHPRYDKVLRRSKQGRKKGKTLGARIFFSLLGTEDAPRLVEPNPIETRYADPASPIDYATLSKTQMEELASLSRSATHLKGDRLSPDLLAVLRDLQRERSLKKRRERARALLTTLKREWNRLYEDCTSADAVWSERGWRIAGTIRATWLGHAMDEPWLTSEDGKKRKPVELAVRTRVTEFLYGNDRGSFAYGLDETDASSSVIRALGIRTDPQVSEMVDELASLRSQDEPVDDRAIAVYYAVIANACRKLDPAPDDMVGDLSVNQLRARFRSRPGLVYANGQWHLPSKVFCGKSIFGHRRPFVSGAERLWRVLRISQPCASDCVDVLEEIARHAPEERDEQIVVNSYLYLEDILDNASSRERARMEHLPLWTGGNWAVRRPVYVVTNRDVAHEMSAHVAVWDLPVAVSAVPNLISTTKATILNDDSFDAIVHERAFARGLALRQQFADAVSVLRDWLTRHDRKLFEACSASWEDLARARIAVDPQLTLEFQVGRHKRISVPARAHLSHLPLTFYFADEQAPGEDDAGGRVLANLFAAGDRDKLALAWSHSWAKATQGEKGSVSLVEQIENDETLKELFAQATGTPTMTRCPKAKKTRVTDSPSASPEQPLPVRRLKQINDLQEKTVDLVNENGGSGKQKGRSRGLRDQTPSGRPIGGRRPAPQAAPRDYSDEEREALALQILQLAINGDTVELRDYSHLRGIGADALDKLRRYFEIKASYGALPDTITLTANEVQRAFLEGDRFLLAVVAGLEEGYDTVVKIFQNPLRNLEIKSSTSLPLTGIAKSKALEVRFP